MKRLYDATLQAYFNAPIESVRERLLDHGLHLMERFFGQGRPQ